MKLDEAENGHKITVREACFCCLCLMFICILIYGWEFKSVKTLGSWNAKNLYSCECLKMKNIL